MDDTEICSNGPLQRQRSLTFFNGLGLVLSLQIGSGIFFAPSQVSNHVPDPGMAVLVWLLVGLLVWTGASSFIELGVAMPKNGGVQEYLRICYGDFGGFLFSWVWVAISKPCAMAMIAMIFAENLVSAFLSPSMTTTRNWEVKFVAIAGLLAITFINCLGTTTGARAANLFLVLKLLAISSIIVTGIVVGMMGFPHNPPEWELYWFGKDPIPQRQTMGNWAKLGEYVTAIYGALFCYGGWESVSDLLSPRSCRHVLLTRRA